MSWPRELKSLTYSSGGDGIWMSFNIDSIRIHVDVTLVQMWQSDIIKFEGLGNNDPASVTVRSRIKIVSNNTKNMLVIDSIAVDVSNLYVKDGKGFFDYYGVDAKKELLKSIDEISAFKDTMLAPSLVGFPITDCITLQEPLISELRAALPFNLSPSAENGNFVLNVDFMPGGSEPPSVTSPSYDYLGFVCPYYAFQTPLNLPGSGLDPVKQEEILINAMASYGAQSFRFSLPWKEILPNIDPTNTTSPDELVGTALTNAMNAIPSSAWSNTDTVFSMGFNKKLDVIPQLLQQEMDLPRYDDTMFIAPDDIKANTHEYDPCAKRTYYYVHSNTYLYMQKSFSMPLCEDIKTK